MTESNRSTKYTFSLWVPHTSDYNGFPRALTGDYRRSYFTTMRFVDLGHQRRGSNNSRGAPLPFVALEQLPGVP